MEGSGVRDLETPVLLLAMPQVQDPFFRQSVVLLLHHNDEGSFGFIANRPTDLPVAEILGRLEIDWRGDEQLRAFFGGPVQPQLGTVLYEADPDADPEDDDGGERVAEVLPGLRLSQQVADLQRLARNPGRRFRFFLGYSGWGEGQLVGEILRNDWLTAPVREDLLFGDDAGEVWSAALESVGVDPATLPSWTEAHDETEEAN